MFTGQPKDLRIVARLCVSTYVSEQTQFEQSTKRMFRVNSDLAESLQIGVCIGFSNRLQVVWRKHILVNKTQEHVVVKTFKVRRHLGEVRRRNGFRF